MRAMTIHDPIVSDLANDHRRAIDEVNSWRGHCIDCFARIELAVVEALDALILSERMPSLKRASLFGPRIEMMKVALRDDIFGKKASSPRKSLNALENVLARRNALVHGVGQIWIRPHGEWLWKYRYIANAGAKTIETGSIDSGEANVIENHLSSQCRSLQTTLANLIADLTN